MLFPTRDHFMKKSLFVLALSVFVLVMTPEEDAKDAISTNREVDELFSLTEDEEKVEPASTVENTTPVATETESL